MNELHGSTVTYSFDARSQCDLPAPRDPDWQRLCYGLADENARLRNELLAVTGKPAADVRDWKTEMVTHRAPGQLPVTEAAR